MWFFLADNRTSSRLISLSVTFLDKNVIKECLVENVERSNSDASVEKDVQSMMSNVLLETQV
jgi:hypothetical protein